MTLLTFALLDFARPESACALIAVANSEPFWSRAIFVDASVLPSKNVTNADVICWLGDPDEGDPEDGDPDDADRAVGRAE